MNCFFDGPLSLVSPWLLFGLTASIMSAVAAADDVAGAWELKYTVGGRDRTAVLQLTRGPGGSLAGQWLSERGQAPVSDVEYENSVLTLIRKFGRQGREIQIKFEGKVEADRLTGTLTMPRREIEVNGARAKPGALAKLRRSRASRGGGPKPDATHRDVRYGPDPRNVIDIWLADSKEPTPLVIYIHGGGFRGGSKNTIAANTIQQLRRAGISVASVEYRLVPDYPLPIAHHDCRRALQFLRSKAAEWNFDKTRVGAFGGSAGAQLCMWLGFHDEMADPDSADPVERESTRLACVATNGGQTTMDWQLWKEWIPGYDKPHRERSELFGEGTDDEAREIVADISAMSLISADDPPIHMQYGQRPDDPVPTDPRRARGWKIHHVMFGVKLKEKMDELRVEASLQYPGVQTTYGSRERFFISKLTDGERE